MVLKLRRENCKRKYASYFSADPVKSSLKIIKSTQVHHLFQQVHIIVIITEIVVFPCHLFEKTPKSYFCYLIPTPYHFPHSNFFFQESKIYNTISCIS